MFTTLLSAAAIVATASAAFDPLSKNNVITYWGQGPNQERLIETCKNSAYDIINVGFVNTFPDQGKGGWPGTNFGNACWGDVYQNGKGVDTQLLKTCPDIGQDVIDCQQIYGKKIFLSIGGGADPQYYLKSIQSARKFAQFLWAAFGPASASTADVPRPWGDAGVDGFDFDIESFISPAPAKPNNYQKAFYVDMIKSFRNLFGQDTSKSYYISGAPQCVIPDAHLTDVVAKAWFDFLFIQFYNTDGCSARDGVKAINGRGSDDISYLEWVAAKSQNPNVRMSIGLPAAKKAASLGKYWLNPTEAQKLIKKFYNQKLFGGVMLWEATYAANNKVCGTDYGSWMKNILNGQAAGKDITTKCQNKRDLSDYEEEDEEPETSTSCTSTKTLTRPRSSFATGAPSYSAPGNWSIPAGPTTTSASTSSVSQGYGASSVPSEGGSESAPYGLCTKTTTLIYRSGSETSTIVEPCASTCTSKSTGAGPSAPASQSAPTEAPSASNSGVPSAPAGSYSAPPQETSPAASSPASPQGSSSACGQVTVTSTTRSTVYVTVPSGTSSGDTTTTIDTTTTSTIWSTTTVHPGDSTPVGTASGSASASASSEASSSPSGYASTPAGSEGPSSSAPGAPEASSPAGYENSPAGGEGASSSAPAAPEASPPSGYENSPVGGEDSLSSAPAAPEASSPAGYKNSPVGGEANSSAPAAPAYPTHGHQHGQGHGHGHGPSSAAAGPHGSQEGPDSTTTVVNVVTVVPVPATSGGAAQPTGAPYPYGPSAGNGTAVGTASASASAPAWPAYTGPQQTGGASTMGVSATLMTALAAMGVLFL